MFKLKKLHPPLGSRDSPFIEASYSEGTIPVVDGLCEVRLPETRDRLLKLGYSEAVLAEGSPEGQSCAKSQGKNSEAAEEARGKSKARR